MEKFYIKPFPLVQSRRVSFGNVFLMRVVNAVTQSSSVAVAPERSALAPVSIMPPLLPLLLPLLIAAIVSGLILAWLFPPVAPDQVPPVVRFTDVSEQLDLNSWESNSDPTSPTTLGGGVVCFDYDVDGDVDLFFVKAASWPWNEPMGKRASLGTCALLRNDGTGTFSDVTGAAGLNVELQGMGVSAADFDNDGLLDLFVTCVGANHLFRNRGAGRFEDVTESADVGGEDNTWSTGSTWIDFDQDGRLDLVVAHYARWPSEVPLEMAFTIAKVGRSYGAPAGFSGLYPSVYRNLGGGRFVLVENSAGLRAVDPQTGFPLAKALAVTPIDVDSDGSMDLLFTYHTSGREGISAGLASASSLPFAQISGADQRFAALQFAVSDSGFSKDGGVNLASKLALALLDYDLDGRFEILTSGGRAEPDVNRFGEGDPFEGSAELWWNRGNGWMQATPEVGGSGETAIADARGMATADFDGDGNLDVVIAIHAGQPKLWRNDQRGGRPWLQIDLATAQGVRNAYGARVEVHTPGRVLVQTMIIPTSYMAQSASTLTFGLGDDARVRKIVVRWPDGVRSEMRPDGVNRRLTLEKPRG